MIIRPRLLIGAKRAERGPMIIRAGARLCSSGVNRSSQILCLSASVWREWMRVTFWPNVDSKTRTSWLVKAISGTKSMVDFPASNAFLAISR